MEKPKDTWLYELKDGNEVVFYGLTNNPDKVAVQRSNSGKRFTSLTVTSLAMTREAAEKWEARRIEAYQGQHGGRPPKYNVTKPY